MITQLVLFDCESEIDHCFFYCNIIFLWCLKILSVVFVVKTTRLKCYFNAFMASVKKITTYGLGENDWVTSKWENKK